MWDEGMLAHFCRTIVLFLIIKNGSDLVDSLPQGTTNASPMTIDSNSNGPQRRLSSKTQDDLSVSCQSICSIQESLRTLTPDVPEFECTQESLERFLNNDLVKAKVRNKFCLSCVCDNSEARSDSPQQVSHKELDVKDEMYSQREETVKYSVQYDPLAMGMQNYSGWLPLPSQRTTGRASSNYLQPSLRSNVLGSSGITTLNKTSLNYHRSVNRQDLLPKVFKALNITSSHYQKSLNPENRTPKIARVLSRTPFNYHQSITPQVKPSRTPTLLNRPSPNFYKSVKAPVKSTRKTNESDSSTASLLASLMKLSKLMKMKKNRREPLMSLAQELHIEQHYMNAPPPQARFSSIDIPKSDGSLNGWFKFADQQPDTPTYSSPYSPWRNSTGFIPIGRHANAVHFQRQPITVEQVQIKKKDIDKRRNNNILGDGNFEIITGGLFLDPEDNEINARHRLNNGYSNRRVRKFVPSRDFHFPQYFWGASPSEKTDSLPR